MSAAQPWVSAETFPAWPAALAPSANARTHSSRSAALSSGPPMPWTNTRRGFMHPPRSTRPGEPEEPREYQPTTPPAPGPPTPPRAGPPPG